MCAAVTCAVSNSGEANVKPQGTGGVSDDEAVTSDEDDFGTVHRHVWKVVEQDGSTAAALHDGEDTTMTVGGSGAESCISGEHIWEETFRGERSGD